MSDSLTVVLADADERGLEGMRDALEASGMRVVAAAHSCSDAILAVLATRPSVALVSAELDGARVARQVLRESPATHVVLIGPPPSDDDLLAALRAGADGYLLRDTDPERLPLALRGALDGEAPIPRRLVTRLVRELRIAERRHRPIAGARGEALSSREMQVLALLGEGLDTRAVAADLGVSEVTVRRHVSGAVAKLGVADRAAAVRLVRDSA